MTYDLIEADKIYKEKVRENPNFDHDLVLHWKDNMPEQFAKRMYEEKYGCHIVDEDMYEDAIALLSWNGRHGAKWTVNEIVTLSRINFEEKPYYEMDYAYVVNCMYADFCTIISDASYYLKMAVAYLESKNYQGKSDERAYHDAYARIQYSKNKDKL